MEQRLTQEADLYLKQLCSMTGTPYGDLPQEPFFGMGSDRRLINKTFFEIRKGVEVKHPSITESMEIELRGFINAAIPIKKLEEQRRRLEIDLDSKSKLVNEVISQLVEKDRAIHFWMSRDQLPMIGDVRSLLESGKVYLNKIDSKDQIISFKTTNDIVLRHKYSDRDVALNFGKFEIIVSFARNGVWVKKAGNNISVEGYFHPHVGTDGVVCWGNALQTVRDALAGFDLKKLIETTLILLSEYNSESPYKSIFDFQKNGEIFERFGGKLRNLGLYRVFKEWLTSAAPLVAVRRRDSLNIDARAVDIVYVNIYYMDGCLFVLDENYALHEIPFLALFDTDHLPIFRSPIVTKWHASIETSSAYYKLLLRGKSLPEEEPPIDEESDEEEMGDAGEESEAGGF